VLLGCSTEYSSRNPFTIKHRKEIINKIFPQVEIITLWDKGSSETWSKVVDYESGQYIKPILYHSRDSFIENYSGKLSIRNVEEIPNHSATKLRQIL
jgi:hypothetical protein